MSSKEIKAIMETLNAIQEEGLGEYGDMIVDGFMVDLAARLDRLEAQTAKLVDQRLAGRVKDEIVQQAIMMLRSRLY